MKHPSDHREISTGARLAQFLRLARDRSETAWARAWQKPRSGGKANRRLVEFLRIARGRAG